MTKAVEIIDAIHDATRLAGGAFWMVTETKLSARSTRSHIGFSFPPKTVTIGDKIVNDDGSVSTVLATSS